MHKNKTAIIFVSAIIGLALIFLCLSYKKTEAQFECGDITEIPIGEAMDGTMIFMDDTVSYLGNANTYADTQIENSLKMIDLALQCDTNNCRADCRASSYNCGTKDSPQTCYRCDAQSCSGEPCPNNEINNYFDKVVDNYNSVVSSLNAVGQALNEASESVDDDIKRPDDLTGQRITRQEYIERKLDIARKELSNCANSPYSMEDFFEGRAEIKFLLSCKNAESIYVEDCKSEANFFCCQ